MSPEGRRCHECGQLLWEGVPAAILELSDPPTVEFAPLNDYSLHSKTYFTNDTFLVFHPEHYEPWRERTNADPDIDGEFPEMADPGAEGLEPEVGP